MGSWEACTTLFPLYSWNPRVPASFIPIPKCGSWNNKKITSKTPLSLWSSFQVKWLGGRGLTFTSGWENASGSWLGLRKMCIFSCAHTTVVHSCPTSQNPRNHVNRGWGNIVLLQHGFRIQGRPTLTSTDQSSSQTPSIPLLGFAHH